MKLLVVILGILVAQAQIVSCAGFFDYLVDKINSVAVTVGSAFREFGEKLKMLINRFKKKPEQAVRSQPVPQGVLKSVTIATEQEKTESSEDLKQPEPEIKLSTPQLAAMHGKKVESHIITTKDGYLLTLHRIAVDEAYTLNGSRKLNDSGTVLLLHGLLGSSADWILLGPEKSLPYLLSNSGYDVWMMNARGNYYSQGHLEFKIESANYWNFSFHEIGEFDIPATIKYIQKLKKGPVRINFIGHSMGATALLVLLSTYPEYNDYFRIAIFLAPLVYMANAKGPLRMLSRLPLNNSHKFGEFLPQRKVPYSLAKEYCKGPKVYCENPLLFFSGIPDFRSWNDSFIALLLSHVPAGGSTKTFMHYEQLAASGKFHNFGDMRSEYPLTEVRIPIAFFSSNDDWLATVPDVLKLFFTTRMHIDNFVLVNKNITHTDFVWGSKADTFIFPRLLEYLKNSSNYTSTHRNEI